MSAATWADEAVEGGWRHRAALGQVAAVTGELSAAGAALLRSPPTDPEASAVDDEPDRAVPSSEDEGEGEGEHEGTEPRRRRTRRSLAARTAVQVAVAGGLSLGAGLLISPTRWYWAVIGSFVVFTNVSSRVGSLRRAMDRVVGTAVGVAGGVVLGSVLSGLHRAELAALFGLIFVAFWIAQVSYVGMVMTLTLMLALLYDLIGQLSSEILLLRLLETGVGAVIGAAVAFVVFPTPLRDVIDDATADMLAALDDLLDELAEDGNGSFDEVHARVRALDVAFEALRTEARPLDARAVAGAVPRSLRHEIVLLRALRYWARNLAARAGPEVGVLEHSPAMASAQARLTRLRTWLDDPDQPWEDAPPAPTADPAEGSVEEAAGRVDDVLHTFGEIRAARRPVRQPDPPARRAA